MINRDLENLEIWCRMVFPDSFWFCPQNHFAVHYRYFKIWKILKFGAEWSSLILFGFVHKTTLLYITDILSDAALQLTQTATLL